MYNKPLLYPIPLYDFLILPLDISVYDPVLENHHGIANGYFINITYG